MRVLGLMAAGALGVLCRYYFSLGVVGWMAGRGQKVPLLASLGPTFPLGTMLINISGSFALAVLTTLALHAAVRPEWRLILGTGFLGAFTTFSTFEVETEHLLTRGQWWSACLYVGGSVILGLAAVVAGRLLALRCIGFMGDL